MFSQRGHVVAHEILEDYRDVAGVVLQVVFAQIDAIQKICPKVGS